VLLAAAQKKLPKPGWNLFSKEQDIEMGREFAKQVEQQFHIVNDKALTDYINRIGMRLVDRGGLEKYPFFFKVVQEDSINAFALPGGPMYVHTGLIKAAENEAQLAGVLAHELSHVVLRHGTNQATKANATQLIAMIGGAVLGSGSLSGQLAQLGIGLGANSVLLKFSRGAESDADLLGSHAMAKAGYNPIEMARFFEKLQAETGKRSGVAEWFSSHPNPGNRVKNVEEQLPYMARGPYNASEGDLARMKAAVEKLPPAPKKTKQTQAGQGGQTAPAPLPNAQRPASIPVSSTSVTYRASGFSIAHPDNWRPTASQGSVTIAPPEGLVAGSHIGYGIYLSAARSQSRVNLDQDTQTLIRNLAQNNSNVRLDAQPERITVAGAPALISRLSSDSPYANTRETDVLITIDRGNTLFYLICIAPQSDFAKLEPMFQNAVRSLRFE
jgi:hypothetical protein